MPMPVHMPTQEPDRAAYDRELVRRGGLHAFIQLAWPLVESGEFLDNWHVGAMCEFLEACQRREIRKGLISVPPGHMKSLTISVFYPAWVWTLDASERFMCASYDPSLSERDAKRHRDIVSSDWYRERWGTLLSPHDTRQVRNFTNVKGGSRLSTSIQGRATGRHAHQRVIDDPIKPKDTQGGAAMTRKRLEACWDFYRGTWASRSAVPTRVVDLIMMQRLHDADLVGRLLEQGGWEYLMLPARHEPKRACVVLGKLVDERAEGELLWPLRFPEEEVKKAELDLGPFASAQLQQNPVDAVGGTFQRDWVKYWSPDGKLPGTVELPKMYTNYQSWDLAFKATDVSDWVVGQCWGQADGRFFLLDQVRGRWSFGETVDKIVQFSATHKRAVTKWIEDKANGPAVIDVLQKQVPGIQAVGPEGGKESRANSIAGLWRSGSVFVPHPSFADWVPAFVEELCRFPKAQHDDQVDAMSQALIKLYASVPKLVEAMRALKKDPGMMGVLTGQRG